MCLDVRSTESMIDFAAICGIELSAADEGAMYMPNGEGSKLCAAWMDKYFTSFEPMPNRNNQIHIDAMSKKEVYDEYFGEFKVCALFSEMFLRIRAHKTLPYTKLKS